MTVVELSRNEGEKRLRPLQDSGLVTRCEPITGSFNYLLVRVAVETDKKAKGFNKADYDDAFTRVKHALKDMPFQLANVKP